MRTKSSQIDFDALHMALSANALKVAQHLLPGGRVQGREFVGSRRAQGGIGDSMSINLRSGAWQHGAVGQAGTDLLGAWSYLRFGAADAQARVRAAREAVDWLGNPVEVSRAVAPSHRSDAPPAGQTPDEAERRAFAERLWRQTRPFAGSKGEAYLKSRGLWLPPEADTEIRYATDAFHSAGNRFPAMVARVRLVDGRFAGIHRTFLKRDGRGKAPVERAKEMRGPIKGGAIRLAPAAKSIVVCEGIETSLAVANATGLPVWCALSTGGIANLELPDEVESVLIAIDNDANNAGLDAANKAAARWHAEGRMVFCTMPPRVGSDFADLLVEHGPEAVARVFAGRARWAPDLVPEAGPLASHPVDLLHAENPEYRDQSQPLSNVRAELDDEVSGFFDSALRWVTLDRNFPEDGPRFHSGRQYVVPARALRVGVGLGKTETALRQLARPELVGLRAFYGVPTHATAAEIVARGNSVAENRERATGVEHPRFRPWKGRGAEFAPGTPMCRRFDVAEKIQAIGMSVSTALCARAIPDGGRDPVTGKPTKKTVHCPHHPGAGGDCAYIRQIEDDGPGIYVGAAELAFIEKSGLPQMDLTVLDEAFWQASLRGFDAPIFVPVRRLDEARPMRAKAEVLADADAARAALLHALKDARALTATALRAAGMTSELARTAAAAWWAEVEFPKVVPSDPEATICESIDEFERTPGFEARKFARMWTLLSRELDKLERHGFHRDDIRAVRLERGAKGAGGHPEDWLRLRWSEELAAEVSENPLLILDATLVPQVIDRFFPFGVPTIEFEAAWPHVEVIQVFDAPVSKGKLAPRTRNEKAKRTAAANVASMRALVDLIGATVPEGGPNALLVSNKSTIEALASTGDGPISKFETAHFNALAGRDVWKRAPVLVSIGQPEPSAQDLETTTRALFWLGAGPIAWLANSPGDLGRLPEIGRAVRMRDGSAPLLPVRHHPDVLADAVLRAIREAQLIQALGRGRPANRTEADPLRIYLLSPVVLPVPVDRLVRWSEIEPGAVERAWLRERAAGGVLPLSAAWLCGRHAGLFGSERTAKRALSEFEARQKGHSSCKILTGEVALLAEYRIGQARRWSRALIRRDLPDPEKALAVALGVDLAAFRWVNPRGGPKPLGEAPDSAAGHSASERSETEHPPSLDVVPAQSLRFLEGNAPALPPAALCRRLALNLSPSAMPAELTARTGSARIEAWFTREGAWSQTVWGYDDECGRVPDSGVMEPTEEAKMDSSTIHHLKDRTRMLRAASRIMRDERAAPEERLKAGVWVLDELADAPGVQAKLNLAAAEVLGEYARARRRCDLRKSGVIVAGDAEWDEHFVGALSTVRMPNLSGQLLDGEVTGHA